MGPQRGVRTALGLACALAVVTGCAVSDPSRYYTFGSGDPGGAPRRAVSDSQVTVGIGPVAIPGYLNRLQIVTRVGDDQVEVWPYDQWAEPMDSGIAQALANGVAARLDSDRVTVFPWRGSKTRLIEYQVVVAVLRFDGSPGHDVTLDTRWRLVGKDAKELVFRRSTITARATGSGIPALVAAMNRAIGALAHEIAVEIQGQAGRLAGG
jgi:uncharacterized lipoprotein YmbA